MGQGFSSALSEISDQTCKVHVDFEVLTGLWKCPQDLKVLCTRLKSMALNFSLSKPHFNKLLQLTTHAADNWFHAFASTRASKMVDGLEFLAASIMISREITAHDKIELLFALFDLDDTGVIRIDEFIIFLKATTSGLHRVVSGFPAPAPMHQYELVAKEYFASLEMSGKKVIQIQPCVFASYLTETPVALHLFSMFSNLGMVVLAWGDNARNQLGLATMQEQQLIPRPILKLENMRIVKVATSCYHSLMLTSDGHVFAVGANICGILGVNSSEDVVFPVHISAFSGKVLDIACGARHSAAVGEKGQVFTWGSVQFGQLGHAQVEYEGQGSAYKSVWDPRTGETYGYVCKPTTVQALFGSKILASKVACGTFSTHCIASSTSSSKVLYSWGNDSDRQCAAKGEPEDVLADPLLPACLSCRLLPCESQVPGMVKLSTAGSTVCGVDTEGKIWSWGDGKAPHVVEALEFFTCQEVAVGETSHCLAICSLYMLEVVSGDDGSAFTLLGLPADKLRGKFDTSEFSILQVGLPFHEVSTSGPLLDTEAYPPEVVERSVLMADRALGPGQWLKLATTDYDFALFMAPMSWAGTFGDVILLPAVYDVEDIKDRVCVFEAFGLESTTEQLAAQVWALAKVVSAHSGAACLIILPPDIALELGEPPEGITVPTGVMQHDIGSALQMHLLGLAQLRLDENPEELSGWVKRTENGVTTYLHEPTGKRRNAAPLVETSVKSTLVRIKEDISVSRLKALIALKPKGIIYCQPSWHPDCELIQSTSNVPVAIVPYEAGEELKCMIGGKRPDHKVTVSFKTQTGGVFSWNERMGESPKYEKNLHDYQVRFIACGRHMVAVTEHGDVFSWNPTEATPVLVEQVEGLGKATKVFAGANQTFVLAELPFQSILC